jgi:CRP-like cAMP-binding protein
LKRIWSIICSTRAKSGWRALLLLARYGDQARPERRIPRISQETLAEMVGTTRSRVNFFMNKFRDLGFIEYNGDLKINISLLNVVLHG